MRRGEGLTGIAHFINLNHSQPGCLKIMAKNVKLMHER